MRKGFLVLQTGEIFEGVFSGDTERAGEVVFNTSHQGYEEIATDPSYYNQIVVMTAPMMGNYASHSKDWESRQIWIRGFICLQIQDSPRDSRWKDLLNHHQVPILSEVDTRAVTLRLRSGGTPWGALVYAESSAEASQKAKELIQKVQHQDPDWVHQVSVKAPEVRRGRKEKGPRVAVLDFGSKENILRELQSRCREIKIFPARTSKEEILSYHPDGLMLTNGPGDPADVQYAPEVVRSLIGEVPIFGICMGHQILGRALGGSTYKLKFGHRGANHPIKDSLLSKVYVTSQNHGYAVDGATLPSDAQVTHVNLNDQTLAGFFSRERQYLGIQYHPESHPGPHEASALFDFYIDRMIGVSHERN